MVCPASVEDGEIQRGCRRPYGPRLILSHGNGFCIDADYPFWSLLTERFDVVLHDLRNHGWNPVGDLRAHGVRAIIGDNAFVWQAIDEHFGNKPKIGVYHSVSATAAFRQLPADNGFAALVMFDPFVPDTTHFLQLEEPETCVESMVEFLEAAVPEIVNS